MATETSGSREGWFTLVADRVSRVVWVKADSAGGKAMKTKTIKGRDIKTRDWALVRLLQGATKSGAHKDHKKHENRNACRQWRGEE